MIAIAAANKATLREQERGAENGVSPESGHGLPVSAQRESPVTPRFVKDAGFRSDLELHSAVERTKHNWRGDHPPAVHRKAGQ